MDQLNQKPFKIGEGRGGAFDGGVITVRDAALIPFGGYSVLNNVKKWHPGFQKRRGMEKLHSTSNMDYAISLYQFSKGFRSEIHTYAQSSDGDVYEATNNPPTVTVGNFGASVFSTGGTPASTIPAHWGDIDDVLVFSNGVDQHQTFPGEQQKIGALVLYKGVNPAPKVPVDGNDLTDKVLEEEPESAILSLAGSSSGEAIFISTPVSANSLNWTIGTPATSSSANGDLKLYYIDNTGNWKVAASFVNGTWVSGDFKLSGSMTWAHPTDEHPAYMFGISGYWYKLEYGSAVASITTSDIEKLTYSGNWQPMQNVWDGILIDIVEAQKYDSANAVYDLYPASAITISSLLAADKLYFACADRAYGFYINVGATPNTSGSGVVTVERYNGSAFQSITPISDGTAGLSQSGFVTWDFDEISEKSQFNGSQFYANWYRITVAGGVSANVVISVLYLPIYDIGEEFGYSGITNAVWKNRLVISSSLFDRDLYVSSKNRLNVLNGSDFAILEPGDGRSNRTVCVKKFHNEIIAWQEEKGRDGGCTTLFEGYNPATYGKLVLSSQVGTFNAKSAVVIDGATTVTKKDDNYQTMAYWISHYGIFMTDGRIVTMVSEAIQNYFDSDFDECIRLGYEREMWVEHDIDRGVLRFGLVSGPTAVLPNVFPIFDLEDGTWSFDTLADTDLYLTHCLQCEASSGQFPIIHIGSSQNEFVYLLNENLNDDGEAIDFDIKMELNHVGFCLDLREANLRMRVQSAGGLAKNVYENSRLIAIEAEILSFVAEQVGDALKRHRVFERVYEETNITLELRENTVDQDVYLYDLNMDISAVLNK